MGRKPKPPTSSKQSMEEQLSISEAHHEAALAEAARAAAEARAGMLEDGALSDEQLERLADVALSFLEILTGVSLYPYQKEFAWRAFYSLLTEDGDETTALFARQSGKTETVACIVATVMVLFPALAGAVDDPRIRKFRAGVWVGIFGPSFDIAGIMYGRVTARLQSERAAAIMADPDINVDAPWSRGSALNMSNGSYVECNSAGPQSHIEGKTFHLIITEETQEISNFKIRKSIHPMAAATGGSLIKIGTPAPNKGEFHEACKRNAAHDDVLSGKKLKRRQRHFQFDYKVAAAHNPRYASYVQKEIERLGFDSDDFRMAYRLHWVLERGHFITDALLGSCGITRTKRQGKVLPGGKNAEWVRSSNVVTYDHKGRYIASLDFGRSQSSTVVTIGLLFPEGAVDVGYGELRYPVHVANWLELTGDDHEQQYPEIVNFLLNYNLDTMLCDATGKGDPIYSRLANDERLRKVFVRPFIFGTASKDVGYKLLLQEMQAGRFTFPDGKHAGRLRKQRRFKKQMTDLEKEWSGARLVVHKPKGEKNARDDYPDSAMMLTWCANKVAFVTTLNDDTGISPFARASRRARSFGDRFRGIGRDGGGRTRRRR